MSVVSVLKQDKVAQKMFCHFFLDWLTLLPLWHKYTSCDVIEWLVHLLYFKPGTLQVLTKSGEHL